MSGSGPVQTRVVISSEDYERVLTQCRDVLGMPVALQYAQPGNDLVTILDAGRATLEIGTPEHAVEIDRVEGSARPAPQFRLAIESTDTAGTHAALVAAGATELAPPTRTPWGSLNSRVELAGGIQLTVFEQLGSGPETGPEPG